MSRVRVADLSFQALGVVKEPQFCFVAGALAGEEIEIGPIYGRKKFPQADLLRVVKPSPSRQQARCQHYDSCGGCQLQHLHYPEQLSFKEQNLRYQLSRFAGLQSLPKVEVLSEQPFAWRHRLRLHQRGGRLGFFAANSHDLVAIERCEIATDGINGLLAWLGPLVAEQSQHISQIELLQDEFGQLALATQGLSPLPQDWGPQLLQSAPVANLLWWHQVSTQGKGQGLNNVYGLHSQQLHPGQHWLRYRLGELEFQYSPLYFTQVNLAINKAMVAQALDWLALKGDESVLDLFCGMGNISLPLAKQAARVVGVELSQASIEHAQHNAKRNQIGNVQFQTGDLFKPRGQWLRQPGSVVVLDPPRKGAAEVIAALDWSEVEKVLYVSCNVSSLAHDLALLLPKGFALSRLSAMDMFPNSYHTEAMVLLTRVN